MKATDDIFNTLTLSSVVSNLDKNPHLANLKKQLSNEVEESTEVGQYIVENLKRLQSVSEELSNKKPSEINSVFSHSLASSWRFLLNYKNMAGIYQFINGAHSYVGSTRDLHQRCYVQHRLDAFKKFKRHILFYTNVITHGWINFTFRILAFVPNHLEAFTKIYNIKRDLTEKEINLLNILLSFELTLLEQVYLDLIKPDLNGSTFANWSSTNKGATGYVRSDEQNEQTSLSHLNRIYSEETKELHRINNLGKNLSNSTKEKMYKSHGGVGVKLVDINANNTIVEFKTKSLLAKELDISFRTVSRWIEDGKIHSTKSLKYPKVKLII
uniref:GIY-YIG endonuclease n=1 Tax=Coniophora puteana TaxID=80637 RepID=A0A896YS15_9AGAM